MRITLTGSHRTDVRPERATLHVEIRCEGVDRVSVVAGTRHLAAELQAEIDAMRTGEAAPITGATTASVSVRSWVPTDRDGHPQERVHAATLSMTVEFRDFEELGACAFRWAARPGVDVGRIEWSLAEQTRGDVERQVLGDALRDATRRAQILADAAGAGEVRIVEIAERGMLGGGNDPGPQPRMARMMAVSANDVAGGDRVTINPEDVSIEQEVDVVFEA